VTRVDDRLRVEVRDDGRGGAGTSVGSGLRGLADRVAALDRYLGELLAGGAEGVGYLLKDRLADVDRLTEVVERVAAGGSVLDPEVVAQMLGRSRAEGRSTPSPPASARSWGAWPREARTARSPRIYS
jgi:hypothetical protein